MLILSRREAEKILFPQLGITVEVSRIQGRTVRLGIDAPDEIRIIRAELEDTADLEIKKPMPKPANGCNGSSIAPVDNIQNCLDAANLAIHLAQNQMRQQLNEKAGEALENALECLENLEAAAVRRAALAPIATPVRESKAAYRCTTKVALFIDENRQLGDDLKRRLARLGYTTLQLESGKSLIEFLQSRDQPSLVLTFHPPIADHLMVAEDLRFAGDSAGAEHELDVSLDDSQDCLGRQTDQFPCQTAQSGLRISGVGSLQKSSRTYPVGEFQVTGWFAESSDADAMTSCFA